MRMREFWQKYAGGKLRDLPSFKQAVAVERALDDNPPRWQGPDPSEEVSFQTPERLRVPSHISSNAHLLQHDRADWQHVDPDIALFAARLVKALEKRGIPMYVHAAFRTRAEQEAAFERGVSKARWPRAPHCQGAAVDIVHGRFHWDMTKAEWALIGKIGKELHESLMRRFPVAFRYEIVWGGDWSFWDPAHWELKNWRDDIRELQAGPPVRHTPGHILSINAR